MVKIDIIIIIIIIITIIIMYRKLKLISLNVRRWRNGKKEEQFSLIWKHKKPRSFVKFYCNGKLRNVCIFICVSRNV